MTALAQSDRRVVAHSDEFNRDPELLNCISGTIYLPQGSRASQPGAVNTWAQYQTMGTITGTIAKEKADHF
jgi:hypothetical protein